MAEIPLTRGKVAVIDDADLRLVEAHFPWCADKHGRTWYAKTTTPVARRGVPGLAVYMHRLILGLKPGDSGVDHINGDGLDNRRQNLRRATMSQNIANQPGNCNRKSQYKGVDWHRQPRRKAGGVWRAAIKVRGKQFVRYTPTELEAAVEYNKMALEHFGEFARLNLVPCSWPGRV